MKPYISQPFTNEFDQVIQPGGKVIIVTKGYSGGINTYQGVYLGYREYANYGMGRTNYGTGRPKQQVVCEVIDSVIGKWSADGKKLGWGDEGFDAAAYETRPVKRITNLWLNMIYPQP